MKLHPVLRTLLWPASVLYGGIVRLRAWLYRAGILPRKRLTGVVISVGNLTVGGTGKTPMAIWLAEKLLTRGKRVAVLTRGYRGEGDDSDEVRVLRKRLGDRARIGVGANRYQVGRGLEGEVDYFVLDDGFQHMKLARDVDLVLVDSTDPFGEGKLMPSGRLREPKSALRRAHAVVITRAARSPAVESAIRRHTLAPIYYAQVVPGNVLDMLQEKPEKGSAWNGKRCFAFCAIGNPSAFFEDLRRWGVSLAGTAEFPDHHRFSQQERDSIEQRARAVGAELLVCTEKDVYNLDGTNGQLPLHPCAITLTVSGADELFTLIEKAGQRGEVP